MAKAKISDAVEKGHIVCPVCKGSLESAGTNAAEEGLVCSVCGTGYPVPRGIPILVRLAEDQGRAKADMQRFWGELYDAVYHEDDLRLVREEFKTQLSGLEDLLVWREHIAAKEMPLNEIEGKRVLEIGSGAGAHSALFASKGAIIFSVDITWERVLATDNKLGLINGSENMALQADAEELPFPNEHFDIVYSNGVLHHTPNTRKAILEVFRVLKPKGKAVIMMYARDSLQYWLSLFLVKGLIMGNILRGENWLGRVTEWMSRKRQRAQNPETTVYSKSQIRFLFKDFSSVTIRKGSFIFQQIPFVGQAISVIAGRSTGFSEAGTLLYGHPWRNETRLELWAGRHIGFALNIKATK